MLQQHIRMPSVFFFTRLYRFVVINVEAEAPATIPQCGRRPLGLNDISDSLRHCMLSVVFAFIVTSHFQFRNAVQTHIADAMVSDVVCPCIYRVSSWFHFNHRFLAQDEEKNICALQELCAQAHTNIRNLDKRLSWLTLQLESGSLLVLNVKHTNQTRSW